MFLWNSSGKKTHAQYLPYRLNSETQTLYIRVSHSDMPGMSETHAYSTKVPNIFRKNMRISRKFPCPTEKQKRVASFQCQESVRESASVPWQGVTF